MDLESTIVALSSGVAPGRRAVIRLSGIRTHFVLSQILADPPLNSINRATAFRGKANIELQSGFPQSVDVLCYFWPNEKCFTGEPSAELHLLGSLPIVECLIETCVQAGAKLAERGAFTLRSFLAGKLDLTQAEAVLAVISAENPEELKDALGQLAGNLSRPIRVLRESLLELSAHLEAGLDFVEEDINFIETSDLIHSLLQINAKLDEISEQLLSRGGRSRVPSVVLVGLPNAGKSTLFNALIEENRAIVSDQAGTTRDAITCRINWQQQLVELVDTAGLEELSENSPRALAQGVLQSRMESADLMVLCLDLQKPPRKHWIEQQLTRMRQYAPTIAIGTKADVKTAAFDFPCNVELDCNSKGSLKLLRKEILRQLEDSQRTRKTDVLHHTMLRCREAIGRAQVNLGQAIEGAQSEVGEELVAADLRAAIQELSFVIGEVHTEDILGEIFSRFCIGK